MNLADIYSYIDSKKRAVSGLLADPGGTLDKYVSQLREDHQAQTNLMSNAYPMAGDKTVLNSPHQLDRFRQQLADEGANMALGAATVWHGSPHKFDKFDSSKIGTGEGAQAYGHGLYLAENPGVASSYQDLGKQVNFDGKLLIEAGAKGDVVGTTGSKFLDDYIHANSGNVNGVRKDLLEHSKYVKSGNPPAAKEYQQALADLRKVRNKISVENSGQLYKVDLPDEHIAKMLDWDKPLSEQAPEVRSVLGTAGISTYDTTLGERVYRRLVEKFGGKDAASNFLREQGIPGIRYLDGGSRGTGAGTSNFVVFPGNEGLLSILERNGAPIK